MRRERVIHISTEFTKRKKKRSKKRKRKHGYYFLTKRPLIWGRSVTDKTANAYYPEIYIRLNTHDGKSALLRVETKKINIHMHDEEGVDIAVIPLLPNPEKYDFKALQEEFITTQEVFEKEKISEGDEVFFIGLFTPHVGREKIYPVVRFGRVAMISEEKIAWQDEGMKEPAMLDLYLMETQSYGGNSGSPVFFDIDLMRRHPGSIRLGAGNKYLLAGVMQGTFRDASKIGFAKTDVTPYSLQNIGISAVVPAYKLYEILFSDSLIKQREDNEPEAPENETNPEKTESSN